MKLSQCIILILFLIFPFSVNGQNHYKAGSIQIEHIDGLQLRVNVELITSLNSEVDSISICFGNGNCEWVLASSQQELIEINALKSNFQIIHTFPGIANYNISFNDCCWSGQGLNTVGITDSSFYLSNNYTIFNPIFGVNNNPIFLNSLNMLTGEAYQPLTFAPLFFDSEGDSVSIKLINPVGDDYLFPDEINSGPNNVFEILNSNEINWISPQLIGEYHFAYELSEYRENVQISSTTGVSYININDVTNTQDIFRNKFSLMPNPVTDKLFIDGENFESVQIYNLQGILIKSIPKINLNSINISNLSQGIYIIVITQNKENYVSKFVKI